MKNQITLFFCCLTMTTICFAQSTRQHDSHAHGIGELNIVVESDELAIELISPAANIVGFEHAPSTDEQKAAVTQAEETLGQADKLFALSEQAGCQAEHVHVESELLDGHKDEEHHDEHAHEEHTDEHHDDEHAHEAEEHHNEHADEEHHDDEHAKEHNDEHEDEEEVHSEFHVEYEFKCSDMEKLTKLQVNLFNVFPATETLNVQLLTPDQQTAISLDKDNSNIELK